MNIFNIISQLPPSAAYTATLASITAKIHPTETGSTRAHNPASVWRSRILSVVANVIAPHRVDWMDDDENVSDPAYADRAMDEIKGCFSRPLHNLSADARVSLADQLNNLTCLLTHPQQLNCTHSPSDAEMGLYSALSTVILRLVDGPDAERTPLVQVAVYRALTSILRHDPAGLENGQTEHLVRLIRHGMLDRVRAVRLAAG
jgi:hypothetical protein